MYIYAGQFPRLLETFIIALLQCFLLKQRDGKMGKREIAVTFRTVTPVWTGNAWQQMTEIRPSSLIGSLRFWFETIMYFAGVLNEKDFDFKKGRFEKELNKLERRELLEIFHDREGIGSCNNLCKIIKYLLDKKKDTYILSNFWNYRLEGIDRNQKHYTN